MDCGRVAYRRRVRMYKGDEREVYIEWYVAPEGAAFFDEEHCFFMYNNLRGLPNIPGECGELTDFPIKYSKGKAPYPDIAGDHFEGSLADFRGETWVPWIPDGSYRVPIIAPACTARPALGIFGGEHNPATLTRGIMGIFGRDALRCPPSTGILGLLGGVVETPLVPARLGILGRELPVEPSVARLGLFGGEVCGDAPALSYSGRLTAGVLYEVALTASGVVLGPDRHGSADALASYTLTCAGSGSVLNLDVHGYADALVSYTLTIEGTGDEGVSAPVEDLYHSGVDDFYAKRSDGEADLHWYAFTGAGWVTPLTQRRDYPFLDDGDSDASSWISCFAGGVSVNRAIRRYETTFEIPVGTDLGSFVLPGRGCVNSVLQSLDVNGDVTGVSFSGAGWHEFTIYSSSWVIGTNTLAFQVWQDPALQASLDEGIRIEWLALSPPTYAGGADALVGYTLTCEGSGSVITEDVSGSLHTAVSYTLSCEGSGTVASPDFTGGADSTVSYTLTSEGTGAVTGGTPAPQTLGVDYWWKGSTSPAYWDLARTFPAITDGAEVASWVDPIHSTIRAEDPSETRLPVLRMGANGINGKTVLRLAAGKGLQTGLAVAQPYTLFYVYRCYDTNGAPKRLLQTHDGGNWLAGPYSDQQRCYSGGYITTNPSIVQDQVYVCEIVRSGSVTSFLEDGTDITVGGPPVGADIGLLGFGDTITGYHEGALCDLAEVCVFLRLLDSTERATMRAYLASEWQ